MKIGDFLIIILIIIFVTFIFRWQLNDNIFMTNNLKAQILINGTLVEEIFLDTVEKSYSFSPEGSAGVDLIVEKGRIRFLASSCQDKICILNGWLDRAGQTSVCLPTRTLVKIIGDDSVDSVAY